jgi:GNAT superfamily N-acetyltransferase
MQIRIGNKQDEPACRALAKWCTEEAGSVFELDKGDSDLKNIELAYIGHDGIFLVAEQDEEVIAFAAACRGKTEEVCCLKRVYVTEQERKRGIGRKLIEQTLFFARNLEYKSLEYDCKSVTKAGTDSSSFLKRLGFKQSQNKETAVFELADPSKLL